MKNILLISTLLISLFSSCKKEEVYTSDKLIGTWYVKYEYLDNSTSPFFIDSIVSNITNNDDGKAYINNIFDSNNTSSPYKLGFYVNMLNENFINIESQNFGPYQNISGNGIYIDNNRFILNVTISDIDSYGPDNLTSNDKWKLEIYK